MPPTQTSTILQKQNALKTNISGSVTWKKDVIPCGKHKFIDSAEGTDSTPSKGGGDFG